MILDVGTTVDRYRIESVLGEGGMAVVYRVVHTELGTKHAMKVLQLTRQDVQERMLQEGRIQANLRHPNVVAVTDVIRVQGIPALVMEYVEGPPLDHFLFRYEPTWAQIDDLVQGILRGVAYAHEKGLIHRDLKLANVLLAVEGDDVVAKITDFGLAKLLDPDGALGSTTRTGVAMGTPTFMPPEQYRSAKDVDHRADLYSVGAMAYQVVTGRPAFSGDDLIELHQMCENERYLAVHDIRPDVPPRMEQAIVAALKAKPEDRPQTAKEMLALWRGETEAAGWTSLLAPGRSLWGDDKRALIKKMAPKRDSRALQLATAAGSTKDLPQPTITPGSTESRSTGPGRRTGLALVAGVAVVLLILFLGLGGLGVAWGLGWLGGDEPTAEQVVPETTPDPVPLPSPDVGMPTDEEDEGTNELSTDGGEEEVPPVEPVVEPVAAPTPVPSAPSPQPAPPPAPVAAPEPSGPPPGKGIVRVAGVDRAYLVGANGDRMEAGTAIAPGTYQLKAFLDPNKPTDMMEVEVTAGKVVDITCYPEMRLCR